METKLIMENSAALALRNKKWNVLCFLYSIAVKAGIYSKESQDHTVSLTSNNPNEILHELQSDSPSPLVKALNTRGLVIKEAVAWRQLTRKELEHELEELQPQKYSKVQVPQSLTPLLGSYADQVSTVEGSGLDANAGFGALLLRLGTVLRMFLGYGIALVIPFIVIKPELIGVILAAFGVNLILAALLWPFLRIKSFLKGILLALFSGGVYACIAYFLLPAFFAPGILICVALTGLLTGYILDCTDPAA
jgi:hypothetical protein